MLPAGPHVHQVYAEQIIGAAPSTALLLGMGLLIGNGTLPAWPVLLGIVAGGVAGDAVGFWAFRWQGRRLLRRWLPRRQWRNYASAVLFFRRWGWMAVFASRFVGPARAFASAIAGLSGMRQSHFQAANLCSAIVWAPLLVMPSDHVIADVDAFHAAITAALNSADEMEQELTGKDDL